MKRLVVSLVALLTAATAAHAQSWKDSPEVQALYQKAKAEGSVTEWETSGQGKDWLGPEFNKLFPGIKVDFYGDNDIATKAITEARGGHNAVDVFYGSLTIIQPVDNRGLITSDVDWKPFGIAPENTSFKGKMAYTNNIVYAVAYNTKLATAADMPKQWTDLLDPQYQGKMVASTFLLPRMIGALGLVWGQDKAVQFAHDIVDKTGILLTRNPRDPILAAGERSIAIAEVDGNPKQWARDGLPVGYVVPAPVVSGQFGVTVMAKAPHPNAARLFAGWLASAEGRRARRDAEFTIDLSKGTDDPEAKTLLASGVQVIYDTPDLMEQRDKLISAVSPVISRQK